MRFPLSWLADWLDLPADLKDIKTLLFKAGIEIESLESRGQGLDKVVVARVEDRQPHPNADRLSVCRVSDGSQSYQIVCGAQNFKAGDVVPLALEGAVLPGDFKIKKSKIRGVESFGMLCAAEELGLEPKSEGLLILSPSLALGQPLAKALGLDEVLVTVTTTANRPDHNCIAGIARELAALSGQSLRWPEVLLKESDEPAAACLQVGAEDSLACPYYSARVLKDIQVGPSPEWLARRLEACGSRSINNIVDVTNLVLFELGQPLHAFDLAKLKGGRLSARRARALETLLTLDGAELKLKAEDLVIADAEGPVALAGVMGGQPTGVTAATRSIVLEAAYFDPATVRKGARRHLLGSESSYRFERGVDPQMVSRALDRAAFLISQLAGGRLMSGRLAAGAVPGSAKALRLDINRLNALLGSKFSGPQVAELLQRRGFSLQDAEAGGLEVLAPSWRRDLVGEADLAEEVVQMAGFDSIPGSGLAAAVAIAPNAPAWEQGQHLRRACLRLGLDEAQTLSYLDPAQASLWGMQGLAPRIDNPISEEQSLLRPSLLPNLALSAVHNLKHKAPGCALFEWGGIFRKAEGKAPQEALCLAFVLAGDTGAPNWAQKARPWDLYDLKGMLEALAQDLGLSLKVASMSQPPSWLHPGQAAEVRMGAARGLMGCLHPALQEALGARQRLFALELEVPAGGALRKERSYQAFSRLPSIQRDLSVLMPQGMEAGSLLEFFAKDPDLGQAEVRVADVFRDPRLGEDRKSLTFSFFYQPEAGNLTDAEVNARHEAMSQRLEKALPVTVRRG
jgi:phenylalanyl-tRNA synthetase beta chain